MIIGPYQPSNEMMLQFYSYYKQATQGPCDLPKPSFWDVINKAKWNAWASLGQMTKEKAMQLYVVEIKKVKEFNKPDLCQNRLEIGKFSSIILWQIIVSFSKKRYECLSRSNYTPWW